MKYKFYIKIDKSSGKNNFKVEAHIKPNFKPLSIGGYNQTYISTIQIPITLEIPDCEFNNSHKELQAEIKKSEPCIEIERNNKFVGATI